MNPVLEWIDGASRSWWGYVAHASWQAAVVGVFLLVLVQVFGRRWPAPLRYALLVLALIKFACPPLLPVPTGIFSQFTFSPALERKPPRATELPPSALLASAEAGGLGFTGPGGRKSPPVPELGSSSFPWIPLLMLVHAAGTGFVGVLVFRRAARLRALARASRSRLGPELGEHYRDLAIGLEVYRIPPLAISDKVEAPMAVGVPRPAIMLPARMVENLPAPDMKAVLAHELAHCYRGDLWLNWVQMVLLALWWFHPVVWLVNRGLREIREDCCDDLLLTRRLVSADAYCDALLRAAAQLCPTLGPNAALGFTSQMHPLGRRIARMMDWTLRRTESVSPLGATAVLLAAALLLPGSRRADVPPRSAELAAETRHASTVSGLIAIPRAQSEPNPVVFPRKAASSQDALVAGSSPSLVRPSVPAKADPGGGQNPIVAMGLTAGAVIGVHATVPRPQPKTVPKIPTELPQYTPGVISPPGPGAVTVAPPASRVSQIVRVVHVRYVVPSRPPPMRYRADFRPRRPLNSVPAPVVSPRPLAPAQMAHSVRTLAR